MGKLIERWRARLPRPASSSEAAARDFQGAEQARQEPGLAARGLRLLDDLRQDLRYGSQMLRKNRGFTLVAVLSLGLGIGLNATVFSFINSLMFRPLSLPAAEQLVRLQDDNIPAYSDYLAFRERTDVFDGLAAYDFDNFNLLSGSGSGRAGVVKVSGNYFSVLHVPMALGRSFSVEEDAPGGPSVAVLNYGLWQSRFGGDPQIIGKSFVLQKETFTIIGVAAREFQGVALGWRHDLWIPIAADARLRPEHNLVKNPDSYQVRVIGRLKPDVGLAQARTAVATVAAAQDKITKVRLFTDSPDEQPPTPRELTPATMIELSPRDRGQAWLGVVGIMSVMGSVLLVACANVANLLLGRATKRRREIAVRLALGAGRRRIVRQLLTESVLLSLLGGALGLLLARWTSDILLSILPRVAPREGGSVFLDLSLDWRILLFTALLSFLTGIAFGLVPALQTSNPDVMSALKDEMPSLAGRGRRFTFRNALVVTQVAVSFVLLVPSGLLIRNMRLAQSSEYGFQTAERYVMAVDLEGLGYDENRQRAYRADLLERIRAVPGIRSATLADIVPLSGANMIIGLEVAGESTLSGEQDVFAENRASLYALDQPGSLYLNSVETGYFETMGIPLARGRDFTARDDQSSPDVIIVNETLARRLAPDGNALGKHLIERDPFKKKHRFMEVVGVAKDAKYLWPTEKPRYFAYRPLRQATPRAVSLIVRADAADRQAITNSLRGVAASLDMNVPFAEVLALEEIVNAHVGESKALIWLAGLLGFLATGLASIGLYGVTAYAVGGRTKEIGIRMALGAKRGNVLRMILSEGLALIMTGIVIGLFLSVVGTRAMGSLLYGVSPTDPLTFTSVAALLMAVALAACYIPARRATKVDPMVALRCE
jgi:predicted permease